MTLEQRQNGFTVIEFIMTFGIILILAALITPKFVRLIEKADHAYTFGVVGAVRSGIELIHINNITKGIPDTEAYPASLDEADSGKNVPANPVFHLC